MIEAMSTGVEPHQYIPFFPLLIYKAMLRQVLCCTVNFHLSLEPQINDSSLAPEVVKRPGYEWNNADGEALPNISSL